MTDNIETIKCPACHKKMTKIFIKSAGVNVDICIEGCGGIYFDNKEFRAFDEETENIQEITQTIANRDFQKVDTSADRYCPNCGTKMVKNYTNLTKKVEIDDCYNCGGKFLDFEELEKIRTQNSDIEEKNLIKNYSESICQNIDDNFSNNRKYKRSFMKKLFDRIFFGK